MPLTVHHLQVSQSERLPWLCEELRIPYTLTIHKRNPILSPPSIYALNPLGQAPVIQDDNLTLCESGACAEYIVNKYGNGKLILLPSHKNYSDYLYWFHLSNSNLQPAAIMLMQFSMLKGPKPPYVESMQNRFNVLLGLLDTRLSNNTWLAGDDFTLADIMTVFSLTTGRVFFPIDLTGYNGILGWLKRVSEREAYRIAREKADPELELMTDAKPPRHFRDRLKPKSKM